MKVTFHCSDPVIVEYFDRWAPGGTCPHEHNQTWRDLTEWAVERETYDPALWADKMRAEAELQEWYDYTTDSDGKRHPILNEDGSKKLLVPTISVTVD